jgi:UPF0755 protein
VRKVARLPWTRRVRIAVVVAAVLVAVLTGATLVFLRFSRAEGPMPGVALEIAIEPGMTPAQVADVLFEQGAVTHRSWTAFYLSWRTVEPVPGVHLVDGGCSPSEIADLLERVEGRAKVKVTIPEGFSIFAIAERLESKRVTSRSSFLAAARAPEQIRALGVESSASEFPDSVEGYLFPATYDFSKNSDPVVVLRRMVEESDRRWRKLATTHARAIAVFESELGWTRREILTLASMVEKEAAVDDERATIASVFLNRLTRDEFTPKLLQSDPTSAYDCWLRPTEVPSCRGFEGKVTPTMNRDKASRYSTYVNVGLPPGPIANPGERSIEAVLAPAQTDYLYFVAKGGGRHTFSTTFAEHQRAIGR